MIKHSHLSFSTAAPCACKLGWHPPSIHRVLSMHLKFYFECKFTTHLCNQSAHLPKKIQISTIFPANCCHLSNDCLFCWVWWGDFVTLWGSLRF